MKSLWLLLPALAGCVSVSREHSNFMTSCSEVELDPNRGLLSGSCSSNGSAKAKHVSQVDLNGCIGWAKGLFPVNDGDFTRYCDGCHIIREDQSPAYAGYIDCKCAEEGSRDKVSYEYDLKKIVEVSSSGYLQCGKAPATCSPVKRPASPVFLEGEPVPLSAVPGLVHRQLLSVGTRNRTDFNDCDRSIARALKTYPNAIPKSLPNAPIRPCGQDQGPGLCCYFPPAGDGNFKLAFQLIEDNDYIYRIEYGTDQMGMFTSPRLVTRHCKHPDNPKDCPGGEPEEDFDTSDPSPKPTNNTSTSITSSTKPSRLSTRPPLAATLNNRALRISTTSQKATGIPDIYFPTPTLAGGTTPSPGSASVSPVAKSPELEIDFGKLDAPGLVDIMLGATNIEEVGQAHLFLTVNTDCYATKDGKVNCMKVVVSLKGHKLGNETDAEVLQASSSSIVPPPLFVDTAQAVLGPRAVMSKDDLQVPVDSTVGYKSKTTSKSKSKKPKKTKTTKTTKTTETTMTTMTTKTTKTKASPAIFVLKPIDVV